MASPPLQAQLALGFPSKPQILPIATVKFSPTSSFSTFRWKGFRKLQINQRLLLTVSATNSNSRGGKSANEGSDVKETIASQGPPLLTILAGFLVFFLVCWVIGSVVMWLISLIVNVPPPK